MGAKFKSTEAGLLSYSDVAIANVENQPTISAAMAELGYDNAMIEEGKALNQAAHDAYKFNKQEDDETRESYQRFEEAKTALNKLYSLHRKKAKVVFRDEPIVLNRLMLASALPGAYINWLVGVEKFYDGMLADEALQTRMARLKLTPDELTQGRTLIANLKSKRTAYLLEVGESEAATKAKDEALAKLDRWMSEFYAVARIALEDQPQLLEALGKAVKS